MKEWQKQLVDEYHRMKNQMRDLELFWDTYPRNSPDYSILAIQYMTMQSYLACLKARIIACGISFEQR